MRRLFLALVLSILSVPAFAQSGLILSEYVEGSGNNKAIELYNGSRSAVNLSSYRIRMYFNGATSFGLNFSLVGSIEPGATYVIVQNQATDACLRSKASLFQNSAWFNGDDAVVLVDNNGVVIDSLGQVGVDPGSEWGTGDVSTEDNTLRRKSSVTSGDTNVFDAFDPAAQWDGFPLNTFDGLGAHTAPPPPPPVTVREIFEIQGFGAGSQYAGQVVETHDNIVTAVGPQGFFIQTPDYRADFNSSTSNGLYVFTNTAPSGVAVGDQVDVKGTVAEFFEMTELTGTITVSVDAHNMPLPAYVPMAAGNANFEPLEGMLVRVVNGSAANGTDQFGETMMVAASSRPFRTPGITGGNHPEIFDVDPTALGGAAPSIVGGARISLAEGPFAYEFGDYSIWATSLSYVNPAYPRGARAKHAGELTVGAQNMFRLFDDRDDPSLGEPLTAPAAYAARLAAISAHVRNNLGAPDVLAVSEVESLVTLQDLAARINADQSGLNYTAYLQEGNDIGGIDVGFLVRNTVAVASVTQLGADDTWIDPQTNTPTLLNDRPPLLLRGSYTGNGAPFSINVIAVHQRSLIDVETARVQQKRMAQANNLVQYIQSLYTSQPNARLVVTGDFNAFEFNDGYADVMGTLTSGASLTDQVLTVTAGERYSYVEEGVAQVLDHSLTSAALNPSVRGMNFVHANADAPASSNPASDHDGVVLFVMSDYDADGYADDVDQCPTGNGAPTVILGGCDSGAPNLTFDGGCTLTDKLAALKASAKNRGQLMSDAAKLLNALKKDGLLTGAQQGSIEACLARWN